MDCRGFYFETLKTFPSSISGISVVCSCEMKIKQNILLSTAQNIPILYLLLLSLSTVFINNSAAFVSSSKPMSTSHIIAIHIKLTYFSTMTSTTQKRVLANNPQSGSLQAPWTATLLHTEYGKVHGCVAWQSGEN